MSTLQSPGIPFITCSNHGLQFWVTRCRFCGFDPFKVSGVVTAGPPRVLPPLDVAALSFPLEIAHDQFQVMGDRLE